MFGLQPIPNLPASAYDREGFSALLHAMRPRSRSTPHHNSFIVVLFSPNDCQLFIPYTLSNLLFSMGADSLSSLALTRLTTQPHLFGVTYENHNTDPLLAVPRSPAPSTVKCGVAEHAKKARAIVQRLVCAPQIFSQGSCRQRSALIRCIPKSSQRLNCGSKSTAAPATELVTLPKYY